MNDRLFLWQSPRSFRSILEPKLKLENIWRADHQVVRDAWIAARFADLGHFVRVSMTEDANCGPDFQVRSRGGQVISVQAVEAQRLGRKRGDEYRQWRYSEWAPVHTDGLQPDDDPDAVLAALKERVDHKSAERYPSSMTLVVYLNVGGCFVDRHRVEQNMVEACQSARDRFRATWVLWGDRLYRCWPNPWFAPETFRPLPGLDRQYVGEFKVFKNCFSRRHPPPPDR